MLLQQTFALKKKYSKYHLWNFWTKSSLSQGETQNPPHAESSHSLLFIPSCHVLLAINNVLFIRHRARLNHELFSSFWQTISPSYLCPHFVSSKTLSQKIMNFWNTSVLGGGQCNREKECLPGANVINKILWSMIWGDFS